MLPRTKSNPSPKIVSTYNVLAGKLVSMAKTHVDLTVPMNLSKQNRRALINWSIFASYTRKRRTTQKVRLRSRNLSIAPLALAAATRAPLSCPVPTLKHTLKYRSVGRKLVSHSILTSIKLTDQNVVTAVEKRKLNPVIYRMDWYRYRFVLQ